MKTRRWMLLLLIMIVSMMSMATFTGVTSSFFVDGEASTGNVLNISWTPPPLIVLTDSFENATWDINWDGNGITSWAQDTTPVVTGPNSASADKNSASPGLLTSDDLDATGATSITVEFWFYGKGLDAGDVIVTVWNGSAWSFVPFTLIPSGDLTTFGTYANTTWFFVSQTISDSQYFNLDFRLQFDSSGLTQGGEAINIDDVLITVNY